MSQHLPGKVARLIGDFRTIHALVGLIEHELEKRIVARHGWVKLDALLALLPQLKNDIKASLPAGQKAKVKRLENLIARLRSDVTNGTIATVRDAMSAHGLKLDLEAIAEAWLFMSHTNFSVLEAELGDIDTELSILQGPAHIPATSAQVDPAWTEAWRQERLLGDPSQPRAVTVYPVFGAGVTGPLAGGHPAQDALIRAFGTANFLWLARRLRDPMPQASEAGRLVTEFMLNDFLALWEMLFVSGVRNEYGPIDRSLLDYWQDVTEPWKGAACLASLELCPPANMEAWRLEIRNKISAHVDADIEIWKIDQANWPMTLGEFDRECERVYNQLWNCGREDIRSRAVMLFPTPLDGVIKLSGQQGTSWSEN